MREVLREGKVHRRIALADAVSQPHAYGVGALEQLGGEITILDGEVWIGRVEGGELHVSGPKPPPPPGAGAALLVLTHVDKWTQATLPAAADSSMESAVERLARQQGVDTARPFPFVIEGKLTELTMHVVNGACPMSGGSSEVGPQAPWRFTLKRPEQGRIIGFFAPGSEGQITHHGTSVHAHALLEVGGRRLTGHVESMALATGAIVRVPASR